MADLRQTRLKLLGAHGKGTSKQEVKQKDFDDDLRDDDLREDAARAAAFGQVELPQRKAAAAPGPEPTPKPEDEHGARAPEPPPPPAPLQQAEAARTEKPANLLRTVTIGGLAPSARKALELHFGQVASGPPRRLAVDQRAGCIEELVRRETKHRSAYHPLAEEMDAPAPRAPSTQTTQQWRPSHASEPPDGKVPMFVFDWDDTLFPTTWLEAEQLPFPGPCPPAHRAAFLGLAGAVADLLEAGAELGTCCIVTPAKRPWVEDSIRAFFTRDDGTNAVQEAIDLLRVPVLYSRELAAGDASETFPRIGSRVVQRASERGERLVRQKTHAMRLALQWNRSGPPKFTPYDQVIAVGDGDFECIAAHELQLDHAELQQTCPFLAKSIRLFRDPSVDELAAQLQALLESLADVVQHPGPLHVGLEDLDQHRFRTLPELFGKNPDGQLLGAVPLTAVLGMQAPVASSGPDWNIAFGKMF